MPLVKCNHCGRPFYDSEKACPFCGHATSLSAFNRVTRTISDNESHKMMEDFLSGNTQKHQSPPVQQATSILEEGTATLMESTIEQVPIVMPEHVVEPTPMDEPSDAILDRAISIAAASSINADLDVEMPELEPNMLETSLPRKKRHLWVWILFIIIIIGLALAVWLKWDIVNSMLSGIIN